MLSVARKGVAAIKAKGKGQKAKGKSPPEKVGAKRLLLRCSPSSAPAAEASSSRLRP
jgi:hypothetical protein